jgi:hypothetical protein
MITMDTYGHLFADKEDSRTCSTGSSPRRKSRMARRWGNSPERR